MHFAYCQWDKGIFDDRLWSSFEHAIVGPLVQPGQQEWWQHRRHWFDERFQKHIEAAADAGLAKPMHPGAVVG